jgi:hypothetical protein
LPEIVGGEQAVNRKKLGVDRSNLKARWLRCRCRREHNPKLELRRGERVLQSCAVSCKRLRWRRHLVERWLHYME